MDGILLINKPAGYTSHDIVGIVRKKLHTKKVGHCGTLDPDATGVLVVCVNKATKAIQFLMSDTKVYRATLSLGKSTDTYDASGKILEEKEVGQISQAQVIDVYGVLDHVLLAKHFKTLMMYIGKDVQVIDQVTGQKEVPVLPMRVIVQSLFLIQDKQEKWWKLQKFIIKEIFHLFQLLVWQKILFQDWRMFICIFLQEKCYILK